MVHHIVGGVERADLAVVQRHAHADRVRQTEDAILHGGEGDNAYIPAADGGDGLQFRPAAAFEEGGGALRGLVQAERGPLRLARAAEGQHHAAALADGDAAPVAAGIVHGKDVAGHGAVRQPS